MYGNLKPRPVSPLFVVSVGLVLLVSLGLAWCGPLREAATILLFVPLIWAFLTRGVLGMVVVGVLVALVRVVDEWVLVYQGRETAWEALGESLFPILLYVALGVAFFAYRRRQARLIDQLLELEGREAMSRLAGGLAHDFNNILAVISGTAQLMAMDKLLSDKARKDVKTIIDASGQAADLVRQMSHFSQRAALELRPDDLSDLTREQLEIAQRLLPAGVELTRQLAAEPLPVRVDRGQMRRVVSNLCSNAAQAMPQGGTLTVSTRRVEGVGEPMAELAVSDTGVGMEPAVVKRVFEPFYTTRESNGGTGLGLTIVKNIVSNHGGRIHVESEPGKGTSIRVQLPLKAQDGKQDQPPGPDRNAA
jgi:signal transduction histidine kinase